MRSENGIRVVHTGKSSRSWQAFCRETLYALFVCPRCGRVNVVRTSTVLSRMNRDKETAQRLLDQHRDSWTAQLEAPGPKDSRLFLDAEFNCSCTSCGKKPVWASASLTASLFRLLISVPALILLGFLLHFVYTRTPLTDTKLGFLAAMVLLWIVLFGGYVAVNRAADALVIRHVEKGISACPPLFGESPEALRQQVRICAPYMHRPDADFPWPEASDETAAKGPAGDPSCCT